ncbi:DNA repair protein [Salipiger sp. IMCC34102]|uniref:DNA repair protein n=1 Tax=Salipiger sp. IMCC34102 TaxID=2510647 RepID=UPI001A910FBA|nr:DNA repair protein [Salipiger sp. IMCC34102]
MTHTLRLLSRVLHTVSLFLVAGLALAALGYTIACALGVAPWLSLQASLGDVALSQAGMWLQIAITALLVVIAFFLPTNARISMLERSHRDFQINMEDVQRAYHAVHHADREGVFTLSSEFDAVRERLSYLRDHPDLARLEPGVLEVAAQMSQSSRHLAEVYSDERVARAKMFLKQRQEEAEAQQEQIVEALHTCEQIRTWSAQVEVEETRVASQLAHLDDMLQEVLPLLGYALEHDTSLDRETKPMAPEAEATPRTDNIVPLGQKPAAE